VGPLNSVNLVEVVTLKDINAISLTIMLASVVIVQSNAVRRDHGSLGFGIGTASTDYHATRRHDA
jgi:hypothetical protein